MRCNFIILTCVVQFEIHHTRNGVIQVLLMSYMEVSLAHSWHSQGLHKQQLGKQGAAPRKTMPSLSHAICVYFFHFWCNQVAKRCCTLRLAGRKASTGGAEEGSPQLQQGAAGVCEGRRGCPHPQHDARRA